MARFFELGPDDMGGRHVFAGREYQPYVRLASSTVRMQHGSDMLVSRECRSFDELVDEIALMKSELDQVLIEAKDRFNRK